MEVEIISKECIKPSSPTPPHLKTYKLSLLDQFHDHFYPPCGLYYPLNQDTQLFSSPDIDQTVSKRFQLLKQSLSETLACFYPLAGKIKDKLSIDCNDEGIYFVEARAKSTLNEFFNKPDLSLILKFIPIVGNELSGEISGAHVAKIQVTIFECGGLVIYSTISHRVGDGATLGSFLKSWSATARHDSEEILCPNLDASYLFPQNDRYPSEATWTGLCSPFYKTGKFVARRFVFDAKAIAILKAKATNSSRVDVVTAFLSKRIMGAFRKKSGSHKPTLLTRIVNLRPKARPLLSEHSFGNYLWIANALCEDDQEIELGGLACQLKEAFTKIDGDFVKKLLGSKGLLNLCEALKDEKEIYSEGKERITFTSVCNFVFYDIDFG